MTSLFNVDLTKSELAAAAERANDNVIQTRQRLRDLMDTDPDFGTLSAAWADVERAYLRFQYLNSVQ